MSQMRKDVFTGRWVIVADTNAVHPSSFRVKPFQRDSAFCPFCESNEASTPPEVFALPKSVMEVFQSLKFTVAYPAGATLFVEGQTCRGIYVLCKGRVKLSASSHEGHTLIFKIAQPGEVLGLNAAVSGIRHETTAETGQPCQVNFVKKDDFLKFLMEHPDACLHAAIHLSHECQQAYQYLRSFVMTSTPGRIARLMLDWSHDAPGATAPACRAGQLPVRSSIFASSTLRKFMVRPC